MNENTTVASSGVATHQPLHILREAREAQGVHLAVLSVAMKVSVKKFEALEAGRFEELPGFTFARALAASACRHLKIDPEPVLAQIPLAESPRLGYAETSMDTPFHSPSVTGNRSVVWLSRPAALVAAALLVGVLLLVFWPKTKPSDLAPAAQPSADVLVSSPEPAQGGMLLPVPRLRLPLYRQHRWSHRLRALLRRCHPPWPLHHLRQPRQPRQHLAL